MLSYDYFIDPSGCRALRIKESEVYAYWPSWARCGENTDSTGFREDSGVAVCVIAGCYKCLCMDSFVSRVLRSLVLRVFHAEVFRIDVVYVNDVYQWRQRCSFWRSSRGGGTALRRIHFRFHPPPEGGNDDTGLSKVPSL